MNDFLRAINKIASLDTEPKETIEPHELQIKHDGLPLKISLSSILNLKSFGNYIKIITTDRTFLITETLTNMELFLPDYFQRSHKSYMVNLNYVVKIEGGFIKMETDRIPISPTYKRMINQKLERFGFK